MKSLKGLKDVLEDLQKFGEAMQKKVNDVTYANSLELQETAKQNAPFDLGKLRQSIKTIKLEDSSYLILANATGLAPYAAYMEFGTGGNVSVPLELADIAIQFKGKGVKKIDLRPRPYMYPALVRQRRIFLEDLKHLLETETKKV
jgi:HK97 gp10 family phage protein